MSNSFRDKAEKKRASAGNPAMMFISQPEPAAEPEQPLYRPEPERLERGQAGTMARAEELQRPSGRNPEPMKRAAQGGEAKSRRLQLLIQPSLYDRIRDRAEAQGISVNETISELLRQALGE